MYPFSLHDERVSRREEGATAKHPHELTETAETTKGSVVEVLITELIGVDREEIDVSRKI